MKWMIRHKILTLAITVIVLPIIIMQVLIAIQKNRITHDVEKELDVLVRSHLSQISDDIYGLCKTANDLVQKKVKADLNVAENILHTSGNISESNETVRWSAVNQFTGEVIIADLPALLIGDRKIEKETRLNTYVPVVDEVKRLVGGTCTIFQRMNGAGDMLRVATNVEKTDHTRAIGTYIPAVNPDGSDNPVISAVLRGETFYGHAYVVNAWYITAYKPVYDSNDQITGVLYVGVKQESVESLRQTILNVNVGETGYVFVLGGKGNHKGHYIISKSSMRDGENIWEAQDADGHYFIQSIVDKALNLNADEVAWESYPWQNGDEDARMKISAIKYFEPWDWVIGAGVYEDEFYCTQNKILADLSELTLWLLLGSVIVFIAGVLVSLRLSGSITKPINHTIEFVQKNERDLTKRLDVTSSDEVGELRRWFNSFMDKLFEILSHVRTSSEDLATAVNEISSTSVQLARGADDQSDKVSTIASSVEEMSASVIQIAENAMKTSEIVNDTHTHAREGSDAIVSIQNGMTKIVTSTEELGGIVTSMTSRASEIDEVIHVINDIAEQTNLLALNAAIEAARAGEQGRGFAVVADEVRKLAERTTRATEEIANTIQAIQTDTVNASESMQVSQNAVSEGQTTIKATSVVFESIIESVNKVQTMVQQIATASQEQRTSTELISQNMETINSVTQQSATGSDQLASTAEQLSKQAEDLKMKINQFKFEEELAVV